MRTAAGNLVRRKRLFHRANIGRHRARHGSRSEHAGAAAWIGFRLLRLDAAGEDWDTECTSETWVNNWLVTARPSVGANLKVSLTAWVSPPCPQCRSASFVRPSPRLCPTTAPRGWGDRHHPRHRVWQDRGAEVAETVFRQHGGEALPAGVVGDVPCAKTTWVWDSEVRCKLPAGVGKNHSITVKVANQVTAIVPGTTDFAYRARQSPSSRLWRACMAREVCSPHMAPTFLPTTLSSSWAASLAPSSREFRA